MEFDWSLITKGNAGWITVIGMGGVFVALLLMYAFISILRTFGRRRVSAAYAVTHAGKPTTTDHNDNSDQEKLAAAIAVAYVLHNQQGLPIINLVSTQQKQNPWRLAGRQELMASLSRSRKPG